jgi:hypothetical protein
MLTDRDYGFCIRGSSMKILTKLAGLLLMMGCGLAQAEWVRFASTTDGKVYAYDPARVASLPDGTVKVWYQLIQSVQSKTAEFEDAAKDAEMLNMKDVASMLRSKTWSYRTFSHTMYREIFDCRQHTKKFEESIDYSSDGKVLDRTNMDTIIQEGIAKGLFTGNEKRFSEIVPGSAVEMLMTRVCK